MLTALYKDTIYPTSALVSLNYLQLSYCFICSGSFTTEVVNILLHNGYAKSLCLLSSAVATASCNGSINLSEVSEYVIALLDTIGTINNLARYRLLARKYLFFRTPSDGNVERHGNLVGWEGDKAVYRSPIGV